MNHPTKMTLTWSEEGASGTAVTMHAMVSDQGIVFSLQTPNESATSDQFSWTDIAQAVIGWDPNLFGVLDEPFHEDYKTGMEALGFAVP